MARKKKAQLPRVTLLAYSRRDLLRFTEAVEKLQGLVNDLEVKLRDQADLIDQLRAAQASANGHRARARSTRPAAEGQQ